MKAEDLIIIGATKSGTSSLFKWLAQLESFDAARKKETCYFLPVRYGRELRDIDFYNSFFQMDGRVRLEATPGYLYGGKEIAEQIKRKRPSAKVVVVIRDPVERSISFMNHCVKKMLIKNAEREVLETTILEKISNLRNRPLPDTKFSESYPETDYGTRAIVESVYLPHLKAFSSVFGNDLRILYFEDVMKDKERCIKQLCEWIGVDCDTGQISFTHENKSVKPRFKRFHKVALRFYSVFERTFRKYPDIKGRLLDVYYSLNTSGNDDFSKETKAELKSFFKRENAELSVFLMENNHGRPEW